MLKELIGLIITISFQLPNQINSTSVTGKFIAEKKDYYVVEVVNKRNFTLKNNEVACIGVISGETSIEEQRRLWVDFEKDFYNYYKETYYIPKVNTTNIYYQIIQKGYFSPLCDYPHPVAEWRDGVLQEKCMECKKTLLNALVENRVYKGGKEKR
ncbi:hypothetical protein M0R04_12020 [Candidatus Dojkabacteria bacterium]|jgi:hypothetical protein|nr:hypothetical protein [Candidatus Dojkabacteria bacterium]